MGPLMTEKKEIDHCPGVQREGAHLPLLIQEPQCFPALPLCRPQHWPHPRGCVCMEVVGLDASLPFHQVGRTIKSSFKTTT